MHLVNINLLGGFAVTDRAGNSLPAATRRAQALISYLALRIDAGGSAAEVAELMGGERTHDIISDIRHVFRALPSEIVVVEGDSIRFNPLLVAVDAKRFEFLASRTSLQSIREAADLYQGNLLEGYASGFPALDEWISEERLQLWQLAVGLYGRLLAAQVKAGWWERAVETANRLLSLDPSQEVVHRTLMRLQLEQGRPDSALRRYHECADLLRREFGRSPSPETERVRDEIEVALERTPAPRQVSAYPVDRPVLILLVEDDAVSSALIEGFLCEAGFEVVAVADGSDALLEIGKHRFDVLILDVNLPTLGGLRLFEIMIRKAIDTPAIFISGVASAEVEARSLEMGAADFLRKPIRREVLLPRIGTILQRRERGQAHHGD